MQREHLPAFPAAVHRAKQLFATFGTSHRHFLCFAVNCRTVPLGTLWGAENTNWEASLCSSLNHYFFSELRLSTAVNLVVRPTSLCPVCKSHYKPGRVKSASPPD